MAKVIGYELDKCPYCGGDIEYHDSTIVYGKSYGMIYICCNYPTCNSFVGVHKGTDKALGRLANQQLRNLKKEAHKYFDMLWKYKVRLGDRWARSKGYKWLSEQLGLPMNETHIGWFDEQTCMKVIALCKPYCDKLDWSKFQKGK